VIFNLDHEMETLHFIPNGEDPYPGMRTVLEGKNGNFRCWYAWVWIRYSTDTVWGMVRVQERVKTEKKNLII
jgi:hypothetical protein